MKLYIDDERPAPAGWELARSYDYALVCFYFLFKDQIDEISFDHDLGDCLDRSGYDLLKIIEDMMYKGELKKLPKMYVHTANASAREKMVLVIERLNEKYNNGHDDY